MANVLLTGGTGKTGRRIAARLSEVGHDVRVASRRGADLDGATRVRFAWDDETSFDRALAGRDSVYLLAPTDTPDSLPAMQPFIDRALADGMRRFVLLSASSLEAGGPMMGAVHAYLARKAPEWAVLRPTWFMQNFSEQQHRTTIREEGAIYSATDDGRVPFIDANDIAAVAAEALTRPTPFNRDLILTGPELLRYDDVAETIGKVIGLPVRHVRLSEHQLADRYRAAGMDADYAAILAHMDADVAASAEERVTDEVLAGTGIAPTDFATFAMAARPAWCGSEAD